jgi:quercetin dioxygenase-like cupin family protein
MDSSDIKIDHPKGSNFTKKIHLMTDQLIATSLFINMNSTLPAHVHEDNDEIIYIVEGSGEVTIENETMQVHKGMLITIPRNKLHHITAREEMLVVLSFTKINNGVTK